MDEKYASIRSAEDASMLKGLAFEEYLKQLFEVLGYTTEKTKASGDFGGDIIISDKRKRIVIQAKQYKRPIGFGAVKEAHFAKSFYEVDEAWVIVTSDFTKQAKDGADQVGVRLVNGMMLTSYIDEAQRRMSGLYPKVSRIRKPGSRYGGRSKSDFNVSENIPGCEGEMVLVQYRGASPLVKVPDGIKALGDAAFVGAHVETKVWNPDTFETRTHPMAIDFGLKSPYCKGERILEVVLPDGLASIGNSCFKGCINLADVFIPDSVIVIEDSSFSECGFTSISLQPNILYGKQVFSENSRLRSVVVEEGVTELPEECFSFCKSLEYVSLPSTLRAIGKGAFKCCDRLKSINIPEGVDAIEDHAFYSCKSLEEIVVPEGIDSIGSHAFAYCDSLEEVYLPDSLRLLWIDAFYNSPVLRDAYIGDVFNLNGVQLMQVDLTYGMFSEKSVPIDESEARMDFEIDEWGKAWCKEHKQAWQVNDIESLEMRASEIQVYKLKAEDAIARNDTMAADSLMEQVEWRTKRIVADLKEMGLADELIDRFIVRRNTWFKYYRDKSI